MDINKLRLDILTLLHERPSMPMTAQEISKTLKLHGRAAKKIQKWLNQLVVSGQIVRIRDNKFAVGEPADLVTGKIDIARSGTGFLTETGGPDILIPSTELNTALPQDRVVVRLDAAQAKDKKRSGSVIKILARSRHDIVGTLKSTGKFYYVVPIDVSYSQDFYVSDPKGGRVGDRVVIRFTSWPNRHISPEAEVIEVLGPADKPSLDTITIVRHFGFKEEFPAAVMREVEGASNLMDQPGPRIDLRSKYVLTIDPLNARDFDDALSLEKDSTGNRVLGVHIADVGHFVRQGSACDTEARRRGNSVYLGDKVIPMFPEQLSNGICSLKPNEDRFTFSVLMTIDNSGKVIHRKFFKSIINSKLRLTYEQAFAVLKHGSPHKVTAKAEGQGSNFKVPHEAVSVLKELNTLAQQLRVRRFANYALDLDVPECEIIIGSDGRMTGIKIVENDISHQLVEECMVLANEAVASEIISHGLTGIHRIHEPPRRDKIEDLSLQLMDMGLRPGDLSYRRNLSVFLKSVQGNPLAYHIRVAVLRSMNRAVYSEKPEGHYGLAKKFYGHFTSPIRRYPDLVLHRQLAYLLCRGKHSTLHLKAPYENEEVTAISMECSATEQKAEQAERALLEVKKYRYLEHNMKGKKPHIYDAVVVTVTNFGMFVEVIDLQLQGLVHITNLSRDFVKFNRKRKYLEAGKIMYKLGTKVKVIVTGIDFDKRRIDFSLVR